ncbi:MAG: glycosyltransferase family 39 protein, partial [Anaerolineae bacterium]
SLRLLSVIFGVLAIPAIYAAGRRIFGPRVGLVAAGLLAISPLHIYYSQEIRMYGLVALLSSGVLAAAWELIGRDGEPTRDAVKWSRDRLVAYILFATAALYTQYYAVFLPIGLTLYAVWRRRRAWHVLWRWLAAQAVVALLYLPWVIYAAPKLTLYVAHKVVADADRPLDLATYIARHLAAFLVGHLEGPLRSWWPAALLLPLPLLIGLGVEVIRRKNHRRDAENAEKSERLCNRCAFAMRFFSAPASRHHSTKNSSPSARPSTLHLAPATFCLLPFASSLLLGWLIGLRYPFFPEHGERLLLLALPAFTLLLAAGLAALWSAAGRGRVLAPATATLLVAGSALSLAAFYTTPRYAGDDYRPLIARTVEQGLPEDTVFAVYPWQVGYWRAYGDPHGPAAQLTPAAEWTPEVAAALDAALARGKVWFPAHLALGAILETKIEGYLRSRSTAFINEWYGPGTRLSGWASAPAAQEIAPPRVRFPLRERAAAVELVAAAATQRPIPAANAVATIELHWRVPPDTAILVVSVRLVDGIGQLWAQHDYEPLGGAACAGQYAGRGTANAADCVGLLIPAGTPPGEYF